MSPPIFDAHLHIIDPRFPLEPSQGYLPPPYPADAYLRAVTPLGVCGGAVVAGSFQGTGEDWLRAALAALGPRFVGVAQLPADADEAAIRGLDAVGVRAVRFNLRRGVASGWPAIERLARLAHDTAGWHAELYLDAPTLWSLEARIAALPTVVVDHLGLDPAALPALRRLVAQGARVKASGFGRYGGDPYRAIADLAAADPGALLFGSDLPSTRAPQPFAPADIHRLCDALGGDAALIRAVLHDNAVGLYRRRGAAGPAPG